MKSDPEDLRRLEEDLRKAGVAHPDALAKHPDIAIDLGKLMKKTWDRFEQVAERGKGLGFDKNGDLT